MVPVVAGDGKPRLGPLMGVGGGVELCPGDDRIRDEPGHPAVVLGGQFGLRLRGPQLGVCLRRL